jgi:ABC-type nitrate/sulfonate/bicarbonate transport system substrate-binding protein
VTRRLVVGTFSPSVPLRAAARLGMLARHGLEVEERAVPSSPAQFRSLLDGDLDAALTSPDNVIAYRFVPGNPLGRTADVRIVAGVDRGLGLGLYGRHGIVTAQGLRGATIGVDVSASGFALAMYALLESFGLGRGDYRVLPLGSTPRRLEALLAGRCDATMLNAGNELRAEDAGAVRLAGVPRPYLGTVLAMAGDGDRDAVHALAAALRDTAGEILAGNADHAATREAAAALGLDDALAARYLDRLQDPDEGLIADGSVDLAALEGAIGLRRRYLPTPAPAGGEASGDAGERTVDALGLEVLGGGERGGDALAGALDPSGGLFDLPAANAR